MILTTVVARPASVEKSLREAGALTSPGGDFPAALTSRPVAVLLILLFRSRRAVQSFR